MLVDSRLVYIYIYIYIPQSYAAVEYTDCISTETWDNPKECPGNDTKQSDREAPDQELWGIRSTYLLPMLRGPLWLELVVPDRILSIDQIQLFELLTVRRQMTDVELYCYIEIL